jgi:acetylornithine/N-succinyldiaminopimelate aminotransferase
MEKYSTIAIENRHLIPFCKKTVVSIERGEGVNVWDEKGKKYIDFTSGWAVTSLGHSHPVVVKALFKQARKIMQNPDSGLTYAPSRARLLAQMARILPGHLQNIFFVNSGAEANDAALKLARKITGRKKIVSTLMSYHGRTIGTISATGQAVQRDRYSVLVPHCEFIPFNDIIAAGREIDSATAAVIVEPIQGEGGVRIPDQEYLAALSWLCKQAGALLIVDEIQTGFWRTGPAFAFMGQNMSPDFLTMGKGIAGGFPFAAVAVSDTAAQKIEVGDHGGTYNGNPLGCAVAAAVIEHLIAVDIGASVNVMGKVCMDKLLQLKGCYPFMIKEIRGVGLLVAVEFSKPSFAEAVQAEALERGLIINLKHGTIMRIFPALNISQREMEEGLSILAAAINYCAFA